MLKFSCLITGDDYKMLKSDTPASRKKVNTLVSILLLPVTMWFINIYLMVSGVMQESQGSAVVAALVAGLIIFMVERSIIMSNGSKTVMVFRVCLGFLIAILGSLALDEVIFKQDIDQQMDIAKKEMVQKGVGKVISDNKLALCGLQSIEASKHAIWEESLDKASKEADGSGGSGARGVHEITRLKINIASLNEKDYLKAKTDLHLLQRRIEGQKTETIRNIEASFQKHALLARIKALADLVCSNGWMCLVYITVTLLLFSLEFIVVILKLSLPKSNYEFKLEVIEEIGRRRLMKMINDDLNHFEIATQYPVYIRAKEDVRKLSSTTVFN